MIKFYESHFEDYLISNQLTDLHPKLDKVFEKFPKELNNLRNFILYGPSGVGKYTQMLKAIKKYSSSELKYEKKLQIIFNKQNYYFKISDIHYEIDMSILGCNSKLLWHTIYQQIVDSISAKSNKTGIIVCKNFHEIHNELLENFYSYMQENNPNFVDIKYILLTEQVSFIPDNIINCCEIINVPRPTKISYIRCIKKPQSMCQDINVEKITNIKNLHLDNNNDNIKNLSYPYKIICDKIINEMLSQEDIKFVRFRDLLYDIFIYNLDINDCIWYILTTLLENDSNNNLTNNISKILIKTYNFLQYYNNNYRPIYHLESYLLYLVQVNNGY
jgi:hypothetical protein